MQAAPSPALTRRTLLTCAATAVAVPGIHPLAATAAGRKDWFRRRSYAAHVGERFGATLADGRSVPLRLAAVRDLIGTTPGGRPLTGRDDAFALELHGPRAPQMTQGISELRHAAFGRRSLFIVPGAETAAGGRSYAVVVNRSA
jgi:hypothetical protein